MINVSVYILTFNNERTIERCLASVQWADEVVVVDSFSTDRTVEICRKYTDRVYQRKWTNHQDQYQYAADLTTHPWIMFVDADEAVPSELAREVRDELKVNQGRYDGYIIYRHTYYLGRWILHGGWNPDYEIRVYDRQKGRWKGGLHAKVQVDGNLKRLQHSYVHYNYKDISDQIQTIDTYSRIAAEDMVREGRRFSLVSMLFNPLFRFVKEYFLKRGFMDGLPGLIIAVSNIFYVFIKYAKLWELEKESRKE